MAVKTQWPLQITRANEIGLLGLIGFASGEFGIQCPLGFIRTCALMYQITPGQDPVNGSLRRERRHIKVFHLPENSLSSIKRGIRAII
jgi:hypothetical protein